MNTQEKAQWILETPNGTYLEIGNLQQWCKENEDLFPEPIGLLTRSASAAIGIRDSYRKQHPWRGWRLVKKLEL